MTRPAFLAELASQAQVAARSGSVFSLLLLDVDHLQNINDCHGSAAGDEVLVGLADRCRQVTSEPAWHRSEYSFGRFDGGTVSVLATNATTSSVGIHAPLVIMGSSYTFENNSTTFASGLKINSGFSGGTAGALTVRLAGDLVDQAVADQSTERRVHLPDVERPQLGGALLELLLQGEPVLGSVREQGQQTVPDRHRACTSPRRCIPSMHDYIPSMQVGFVGVRWLAEQ